MIQDIPEPSVANFVQKSYQIITNPQNSSIVDWLPSGKQFIIKDTDQFESVILPHYFRHRNINSFIRQLNMYGFHKSRKEPTKNIFSHPNFIKGRPDLLLNVRRKLKQQKNEQNTSLAQTNKKQKQETVPVDPIYQDSKQIQPFKMCSKELLRSKQLFMMERREKQLEKTATKPDYIASICSMENIEDFGSQGNQKSMDCPFRSLIEKSVIMELNPEIYNLKLQNITSLNHIDQIEFDFSSGVEKASKQSLAEEIQKQRKRLSNRMAGYSILQTINFMSELNL